MAAADVGCGCAWLGWFSLVPLFMVIRLRRPGGALLAGGLWGVCLYLFSVGRPDAAITPGLLSFVLLLSVPSAYAYLSARLTRRIGFNPFVLGVAWMGVELAFASSGLHAASAAGAQGHSTFMHWISQAFGYVLAAFVIVVFSASLVSVLGRARLPLPRERLFARLPVLRERALSQTLCCVKRWTLRQAYPRAPPPVPVAAMT